MPSFRAAEVLGGLRLLSRLPAFLRHPITLDAAHQELQRRFSQRASDFENLVLESVYGDARSPYRALLRTAGCERGDFRALLAREGIEGALAVLARQGVYLTIDEFKGRRRVQRGSTVLDIDPARLATRASAGHVTLRSGGSRSQGTRVPVNLAYVRDRAVSSRLVFAARGGEAWTHGVWGMWGRGAMVVLLELSAFGTPPEIWFSQVDPDHESIDALYRGSASALRGASLLAGQRPPRLAFVPLDRAIELARWMARVRGRGGTAHVHTHASSAVRICAAAEEAGIDIRGAHFTAASEPMTAARLEAIRRVGAHAWPQYASVESGVVGLGCGDPAQNDDVHFLHDRFALIQGAGVSGLDDRDLLLTSLRPTVAPFVLLNVSLGDQAEMQHRRCACTLGELGWHTHLHGIRSREKMTVAGMSLLDSEVIRVLEVVLPQRFGGGPTDYQLLEETTEDGHDRLSLLVDPALGPLEAGELAETFFEAVGADSDARRISNLLWRESGMLMVKRMAPLKTDAGKIQHVHRRIRA